jgi:hypothetical protein
MTILLTLSVGAKENMAPSLEDSHIDVPQMEGPASETRGRRPCEGSSAPFDPTSQGKGFGARMTEIAKTPCLGLP